MHPRNPYLLTPPDFHALSLAHPSLRRFVFKTSEGGWSIDFKRSEGVRELTRCLLLDGWGLEVELREDRLCPTVANRLDYLLWIQDLLLATAPGPPKPSAADSVVPSAAAASEARRTGLDVGTGSTAIYPLLGCKLDPSWSFLATEIDPNSTHYARGTISRNRLTPRIALTQTAARSALLAPLIEDPQRTVGWTMCNPPFYESAEEIGRLAEGKALGPHAVCTGAETEMITPGGEVAFVRRMVAESLSIRSRCQWYTSLLGKLSSVPPILTALRDAHVVNYVVHELIQGQTRRWVVGWSFDGCFARDSIGRPLASKALHALLPPSNSRSFAFPAPPSSTALPSTPLTPARVWSVVLPLLAELRGTSVVPYPSDMVVLEGGYVVQTTEHSWSRAARRKAKLLPTAAVDDAPAEELFTCLLELSSSPPSAPSTAPPPDPSSTPSPVLTLSTHFLSVPSFALADAPARRLAWDGLWLHLLRKVKDTLLAPPETAGDTEMT